MPITAKDRRRYRLYNRRNRFGRRLYTVGEIARLEGVSRQAIYLSLWKFKATTPLTRVSINGKVKAGRSK